MLRRPPRSTPYGHTLSLHDALPSAQDVLVQTGAGCGHQEPQVDPSITLLRRLAITLRDRAIRTVDAQAQDRRRTWLTCWLVEELPHGRLIELKHGERRFGSSNRKAIRSEEHKSELQSLMRIPSAVFCVKKTKHKNK